MSNSKRVAHMAALKRQAQWLEKAKDYLVMGSIIPKP